MKIDPEQYQLLYDEIKKFILLQVSPFKYYSLFSHISNNLNLSFPQNSYIMNLFQKNFLIKNILYNLQFEFYKDYNFALIFENDLIFFSKIPEYPSFFSIIKGEFIEYQNIKTINKENLPTINALRDYFFSFENFEKADENSIENAIESGFLFIDNPSLFDEALKIFNLTSASLNMETLNKAYRRLVKKYHPDSSDYSFKDNDQIFKIYDAYKLLKNIISL